MIECDLRYIEYKLDEYKELIKDIDTHLSHWEERETDIVKSNDIALLRTDLCMFIELSCMINHLFFSFIKTYCV